MILFMAGLEGHEVLSSPCPVISSLIATVTEPQIKSVRFKVQALPKPVAVSASSTHL
jgi:hypothetical protein